MSESTETEERPLRPPVRRGPGGGGPFGGMNMPVEKSMNFGPSAKRLAGRLRPESVRLVLVTLLAVVSVTCAVLGPKLLGNAINLVFAGAISMQFPKGVTQTQIIAGLRAQHQNQIADLLSGTTFTPGAGIDFTAVGDTLMWVLALYIASSLFSYLQAYVLNGITQRTVYR
ncbi:MAG TPA: ABC transporter ATP-binding protein, partial [Leifsonia sp.]